MVQAAPIGPTCRKLLHVWQGPPASVPESTGVLLSVGVEVSAVVVESVPESVVVVESSPELLEQAATPTPKANPIVPTAKINLRMKVILSQYFNCSNAQTSS